MCDQKIKPEVLKTIVKNMGENEDNYITFSTIEEFQKYLDSL